MRRIGIELGKDFDIERVSDPIRRALEAAPSTAQKLMEWKIPTIARVANYWSMNTDTMGVYGNYYLKRAIVAQAGLGANLPEDAIYPLNLGDQSGRPLDGANKYVLHFEKATLPPVDEARLPTNGGYAVMLVRSSHRNSGESCRCYRCAGPSVHAGRAAGT